MSELNKHNPLIKFATPVAPQQYLSNQVQIAEAKAFISAFEEMNEAGKQSHDEIARELEQKIREGEQARKLLSQLRAQSTEVPPSMSIQGQAIDYPPSTSRIEEVPNYDPGSGHSQQVQYHQFQGATSTHNFIPHVTAQPVATSSYQQYDPQQRISGNANGGQSQQHSQHSQQPVMQNSSSRATSYTPLGFPHPQQLPIEQDQGNYDNRSRPMVPTQGQIRVSTQEPLHYSTSGSSHGQRHIAQMYSSPQTHAPGPSSHATYTSRFSQYAQQSASTQNIYPEATVSQTQAATSGTTYSQGPLPHKTTDIANQSQSATTVTTSRPVARSPQPNASSNSVPVAVIAMNPQTNPNGNRTNQNATHDHPSLIPTTLPSMNMNYTQFIRELREAIKNWEVKVPPNSYCDHPSNYFRVHKDLKSAIRIVIPGHGQNQVINLDQFCDWIRRRNVTTSVTPAVPANSQASSSSISNALKAIPSTAHKANVQTTSQPQSAISRPEYPQPGASSSKQTPLTMSTIMHNQGTASSNHQIATSSQTGPLTSQIQLSTPSISLPQPSPLVRPLPPSTAQTPSSVSVPKTPGRQLSTIVNGVPRSAKQADKKSLASHILFGLGKRRREPDTSPTAPIEPQPKRHAQQGAAQVGVGIIPSTSYTIGQTTQTVRKPNLPVQLQRTSSTASSSLQQPLLHVFTPTIPQETQQISQASSSLSSGDRRQLANTAFETPSPSKVAAAIEVPEVSKTFSDRTLQDASNVPLSVVQSNSQQELILDDRPVTSSGYSVPLATSSTVVQTSTLPSPVPLAVPVAVSSELSSGVNENTTQPVSSSTLEQPQPNTPAKLRHSFTGVSTPSEMSAQIPQKNQPLFLPSPVSSPGMDANDDDDDDISTSGRQSGDVASRSFDLRKSSSSVKRKNLAYVLVPPRPQYLVKYFRLKMSRTSLKKRMGSRSSVSTSVAGEEDYYNAAESHSPSYTDEQRAAQLACTRLQQSSCKWDGCSVKMNSADALIRHLNRQHKPPSTSHSNSFLCRWTQCGRRCNLHEKHLEKHACLPLNCPYEDCDESFRSAPPMWKHMRREHKNDTLKPSAQPSYPEVKLPNVVLGVIPSYMITTRRIDPDEISEARHAILGPRVLRNIAGLARERSRNKLKKTVRSSNGDIIPDEDISNDYDFLIARPTRYSSQLSQPVDMRLEDLNSEDISRMVDEGLTLWGGQGDDEVFDREHRTEA